MAENSKQSASEKPEQPKSPPSNELPEVKPSSVKPRTVDAKGTASKQSQGKPRRCDLLNAIRVDRVASGTDRVGLGEFLHRLVTWAQRTGYKTDPENPFKKITHLNEAALEPLRRWLEQEAPEDFSVEHLGAYIGPDERTPIATSDEGAIEQIDAMCLLPNGFAGPPVSNVLDLRDADYVVSIGDPGTAPTP